MRIKAPATNRKRCRLKKSAKTSLAECFPGPTPRKLTYRRGSVQIEGPHDHDKRVLSSGLSGGAYQVLQIAPWAALRLIVELPGAPLGLLQGSVAGDHNLPEERHRDHLEIFPFH